MRSLVATEIRVHRCSSVVSFLFIKTNCRIKNGWPFSVRQSCTSAAGGRSLLPGNVQRSAQPAFPTNDRSRRREEADGPCVHFFHLLTSAATERRVLKFVLRNGS